MKIFFTLFVLATAFNAQANSCSDLSGTWTDQFGITTKMTALDKQNNTYSTQDTNDSSTNTIGYDGKEYSIIVQGVPLKFKGTCSGNQFSHQATDKQGNVISVSFSVNGNVQNSTVSYKDESGKQVVDTNQSTRK